MAYLNRRSAAPGVLLGVVLLHVALVLLLLSLRTTIVSLVPSDSMIYVALAPPPPPPVIEVPTPSVATPAVMAPALPVRKTPTVSMATKADTGQSAPPSHEFVPGAEWGSADSAGAAGAQRATRVPDDYAERVKARVVANLVRPTGATYAASGKAPVFRQCTIPYELVVDREGKVISFHIEPCGDPLFDAAAETALRKSGPHPPPPHAGAESYVIYGTANFKAP